MIAGVSTEVLLVGLVMPIVVALISATGAVMWRRSGGDNPGSILGEGHQSVKEHMDHRAAEHSRMSERLVTIEELTRGGLDNLVASLGRVEATLIRIEGKLPTRNPRK